MTTAILAGGNELNASTDYMTRLAQDIMVRVQQPKILSCNFAKPNPTGRRESTAIWMSAFKQHFPDSEIIEAKEELFYEQVADADVIYLHGGRTQALFDALPDFARSCEAFRGKVVVGGSAGANYLARLGCSPNHEVFLGGLGLLMSPCSYITAQPILLMATAGRIFSQKYKNARKVISFVSPRASLL